MITECDKPRFIRNVRKDLTDFAESGYQCAKVDIAGYKNLNAAYASYFNSLKNSGIEVIRVAKNGGSLYLVRK